MAVILGTPRVFKRARIKLQDTQGQVVNISFYLMNQGAELDAAVVTAFTAFLTSLEAVSACKVLEATLDAIVENTWTSNTVPVTAQYATVDNVMALNFTRANPLIPTSTINKTFPIPAYTVGAASEGFPNAGVPNATNPDMIAIENFLNARLAFRYSGDGLIYNGLTYQASDSHGISLPDLVDNL